MFTIDSTINDGEGGTLFILTHSESKVDTKVCKMFLALLVPNSKWARESKSLLTSGHRAVLLDIDSTLPLGDKHTHRTFTQKDVLITDALRYGLLVADVITIDNTRVLIHITVGG